MDNRAQQITAPRSPDPAADPTRQPAIPHARSVSVPGAWPGRPGRGVCRELGARAWLASATDHVHSHACGSGAAQIADAEDEPAPCEAEAVAR